MVVCVKGYEMMRADGNKRLMQDIFSELAKGNDQPLVEALADDIQWTWMGTVSWTRTFTGKESVVNELLRPAKAMTTGESTVVVHRFIGEGDFVVVEFQGQNTLLDGRAYNNTYCWVCRFAGSKLRELHEYMDTELITAVFPPGDKA